MIGGVLNLDQLFKAINETIYMTVISLTLATILGLLIGILLYCTQPGGLFQNKIINRVIDVIINVLRAIPFTKRMVGSMLGATAALPSLVFAAAPFYARMCIIAFQDVNKGTIEASKAMGASNWQIILKVLLPEALPSLISGITVTGISLISYTAMAGAIGAGGLGNLAYLYGFARRNDLILYTSTVIIIIIVFVIQWIGDAIVKRIDKR